VTILTYRQANPESYRIKFDGVEVGSVSKRTDLNQQEHWHWAVDIMPLMDHGGRPPSGNANTFEAALAAFKDGFTRWHDAVPAGLWRKNRDHIKACDRWG
jgi:hypothetical protein